MGKEEVNNIIEVEDEDGLFAMIPHDVSLNKYLTGNALKIYVYLKTRYSIKEWKFWNKDIMDNCNIKDPHSLSKYMKELEHYNYIVRELRRGENGKLLGGYRYIILSRINRIVKVSQIGENNRIVKVSQIGENTIDNQTVKESNRIVKLSQIGQNCNHREEINLYKKKYNNNNKQNSLKKEVVSDTSINTEKRKRKKVAPKKEKERFIYRTVEEARTMYDEYIKTDPDNEMYKKFVNFMFGINNNTTIEPLSFALKFEKGIPPKGLNNLIELSGNNKELIKDKLIALNDKKDMYVLNRTDLYLTMRNWIKMNKEKTSGGQPENYMNEINKVVDR